MDDVTAGDVICLAGGERGNLRIANLHGTPEKPITIRNHDGQVRITGTDYEAGLYIMRSSAIRITGTGIDARCGAEFNTEDHACGIVVDGARKGLKVATSRGDVSDLEIDHVAILRPRTDVETRGMAIHPVDRQVISGIRIHHNLVVGTGAEGIYIGSEPRDKPFAELGKVEGVEIAYNRLDGIGWDGIKLKVSIGDSSVHHNVMQDTGLAGYEAHQSGITVAVSVVDVYSNTIIGSVEGIKSGRGVDSASNRVFNNLIRDVQAYGIKTTDDNAHVFNNSVIGSRGVGIMTRGDGTRVVDNLIVDAEDPMSIRGDGTVSSRNVVGTADELGVLDAPRGAYRLTATSPAVDVGRFVNPACRMPGLRVGRPADAGLDDRYGTKRPLGCRSDAGALEHVPSASSHRSLARTNR